MKTSKPLLSIISPVYRAEKIVDMLVARIVEEVSKISDNFELILVEDGSPDHSWQAIERNCAQDSRVKGVKLSRNFGQHYAITAGLELATGDLTVLMDCDLQDNPAHIHLLYAKHQEGFDTVFTQRLARKHSFFKWVTAKAYHLFFRWFANHRYDLNVGSLVLFSQHVREEFLRVKDQDRLSIQVLKWLGFRQTYVTVSHDKRAEGKSSYSVLKLLNIALQGVTSYSDKLLRLSMYIGLFFSIVAGLGILTLVFLYFYQGVVFAWASLGVLMVFCTGLILTSLGIAGIYIGKTLEQSRNRPLYVIEEKVNIQNED